MSQGPFGSCCCIWLMSWYPSTVSWWQQQSLRSGCAKQQPETINILKMVAVSQFLLLPSLLFTVLFLPFLLQNSPQSYQKERHFSSAYTIKSTTSTDQRSCCCIAISENLWYLFALTNWKMEMKIITTKLLWLLMFISDIVPFSYEKSMRERAIELMQDARLIDGYMKYIKLNLLFESWQVCLDQQSHRLLLAYSN